MIFVGIAVTGLLWAQWRYFRELWALLLAVLFTASTLALVIDPAAAEAHGHHGRHAHHARHHHAIVRKADVTEAWEDLEADCAPAGVECELPPIILVEVTESDERTLTE